MKHEGLKNPQYMGYNFYINLKNEGNVGSHGVYHPAIRLHRGTCSFQVKDPVTGTLAPFNVLGESFAAA